MAAKRKRDPLARSMEAALRPERFISSRESWDFVEGLEEVKGKIGRLMRSEPRRAVGLLETFIAACYEKAEEIDDSGGRLGAFVEDLFLAWIKARQAAKDDPQETVKRLLCWMDDDEYGFCYRIERNVVKVLNRSGLRALAETAEAEFRKELGGAKAEEKGDRNTRGTFRLRRMSSVLRATYARQRDAQRYLAVVDEMGLTPRDCEEIADIHRRRGKPEDALTWVERGLKLRGDRYWGEGTAYALEELKRTLLKGLGRSSDALQSAWRQFQERPSEYSYKTLLEYVPDAKRSEWHGRVLEVLEEADLSEAMQLYVLMKEWERLATLVRKTGSAELGGLSHYRTEPAANHLEKRDPAAAAKLYKALGLRILKAGRSKDYGAALDHFERVKKCLEAAGREKEWEATVREIRAEHGLKKSFTPAFEAIVARGAVPRKPPPLERAKRRRGRLRST